MSFDIENDESNFKYETVEKHNKGSETNYVTVNKVVMPTEI